MNCQHEGCTRTAGFVPKILVPASGWLIDMHSPLAIIANKPMCREHCEAFLPDFDESPKLRELYEWMARSVCERAGPGAVYIPPDFSRAFVQKVRLDSEEYRLFERARS